MKNFFVGFISCLFFFDAYSAVGIEDLILGRGNLALEDQITNPLSYVFKKEPLVEETNNPVVNSTEDLFFLNYYSFYKGGENLNAQCEQILPPQYMNIEERNRAIRSMMATLQYIGLKTVVYFFKAYAREMNLNEDEMIHLSNYLVGNYCSPNMTLVSFKELKKNLLLNYKDPKYQVYRFQDYPWYSPRLYHFDDQQYYQREFLILGKIFRSFCSFGEDENHPRLLTPFLKNRSLMNYVIMQMAGKKAWVDHHTGKLKLVLNSDPNRVLCQGTICRPTDDKSYQQSFPQILGGGSDFVYDLTSLYCHHIANRESPLQDEYPQIKKWILNLGQSEEKLMVDFFNSLLTKGPSLMSKFETLSGIKEALSSSIDDGWDFWADNSIEKGAKNLLYEESVTLEPHLLEKESSFDEMVVEFDLNLGEFDRAQEQTGKMGIDFYLSVQESIVYQILETLPSEMDESFFKILDQKEKEFASFIRPMVQNLENKLLIPPWKGDFSLFLAEKILQKSLKWKKQGYLFSPNQDKIKKIKIAIFYGPYALKYINYRFQEKQGVSTIDFY